MRNIKQEIDNMFQGYWQTTIGLELKGKVLGIIGLGKNRISGCKNWQSFWNASCSLE